MNIIKLVVMLFCCTIIQSCSRQNADGAGAAVGPETIYIHVEFCSDTQDFLFSLSGHPDKYRLPALVSRLSSARRPGKTIVLDLVADCKMTSQEVDEITAVLKRNDFIVENFETARNSDY
jgi:hypothetical protein